MATGRIIARISKFGAIRILNKTVRPHLNACAAYLEQRIFTVIKIKNEEILAVSPNIRQIYRWMLLFILLQKNYNKIGRKRMILGDKLVGIFRDGPEKYSARKLRIILLRL